jgi:hypothetical protein
MEACGKQDLWVKQKPEVLAALRQQAIIQSAESSNRIEGVTVPTNRLRPLILGGVKPRGEDYAGRKRARSLLGTHRMKRADQVFRIDLSDCVITASK